MKENKGIFFALITALISGFSVFLNKFAVSFWDNSGVFATAKNLIVAIFLVSLIILFKKLAELKNLSKKQWFLLILVGFVGGSVPFLLFFKGLSLTSATNAAFIHKTLFLWVALLALPFLKEKLSSLHFLGIGVLLAGIYLFNTPAKIHFGYGDFLILIATLLWAFENILAKIVLRSTPPLIVGSGRMFFGSIFLLIYLAFTGGFGQLLIFSGGKVFWLFITGILLFGYVVSWYAALKNAPATVVSCLLVMSAPITVVLNSVFITHSFKGLPIFSAALIILGALFFTRFFEKLKNLFRRKDDYGHGRLVDVC